MLTRVGGDHGCDSADWGARGGGLALLLSLSHMQIGELPPLLFTSAHDPKQEAKPLPPHAHHGRISLFAITPLACFRIEEF